MIESYEDVPYTGYPFATSHPDRLATMAILHGLEPPPVESCRVLELGCGDGGNLVPMAYGLPGARFTGVDLSPSAVRRGQVMVEALQLRNVSLAALDLRQLDGSLTTSSLTGCTPGSSRTCGTARCASSRSTWRRMESPT
jgi:hypothetical protein